MSSVRISGDPLTAVQKIPFVLMLTEPPVVDVVIDKTLWDKDIPQGAAKPSEMYSPQLLAMSQGLALPQNPT